MYRLILLSSNRQHGTARHAEAAAVPPWWQGMSVLRSTFRVGRTAATTFRGLGHNAIPNALLTGRRWPLHSLTLIGYSNRSCCHSMIEARPPFPDLHLNSEVHNLGGILRLPCRSMRRHGPLHGYRRLCREGAPSLQMVPPG